MYVKYEITRSLAFGKGTQSTSFVVSFFTALSALQVYRGQTMRQKHGSLWGYRRQPYTQQKYSVCRLMFCESFPEFGVV